MLVENINYMPVRLKLVRVAPGHFELHRDGEHIGSIKQQADGSWRSWKRDRKYSDGVSRSFRTAALRISRYFSAGGGNVQNYGLMHVLRVQVETAWYYVLISKKSQFIVRDPYWEPLQGVEQALVQKVIQVAEKYLREHF